MEKAIKNKGAERVVVGILINHPDWIIEVNGLKYKHFFDKAHKLIFYLVHKLIKENYESIDSMSILARAERVVDGAEVLNANGGYEYLEFIRGLTENYTKQDLKKHAEEVITCAYKREQIKQKTDFLRLVQEKQEWTIGNINTWLQEKQFELQTEYTIGTDVRVIGDVFDETWAEIESMRGADGIVGLPSKIPIVNDYFSYRQGELVVLGARAKFGDVILTKLSFFMFKRGGRNRSRKQNSPIL